MKRVNDILDAAEKLHDRELSRNLRLAALDGINDIIKTSQTNQSGIFQSFRDDKMEYPTKQNKQVQRGGESYDADKLYNLSEKHPESKTEYAEGSRSLSTRYSPDRVGVQARRLSDGVYQDPYTNKIYDWNEGFTTEDGSEFNGSHISLQTDIEYR